jgi:hypothetical protein
MEQHRDVVNFWHVKWVKSEEVKWNFETCTTYQAVGSFRKLNESENDG